jgi:hypothetical protein
MRISGSAVAGIISAILRDDGAPVGDWSNP